MRLFLTSLILGLAWFSAANIVASAATWTAARFSTGRTARAAAPVLLCLRLLPATVAGLVAFAVFVPAHLRFEPAASNESVGVVVSVLAALGFALLVRSAIRFGRVHASARALQRWMTVPLESKAREAFEATGFPGMSLAGILRTRILVGSEVRAVLTADELDVAVAHEHAHRAAFDNLKRCAMFCAPDLLGWTAAAKALEAQWRALSEGRADMCAADGDAKRAMHLASALLKATRCVARPHGAAQLPVWSGFHEPSLLEARIRRLVAGPPAEPAPAGIAGYGLVMLAGAAAALWVADAFHEIHQATEVLIAVLP